MAVAKTYEKMALVGEPFQENGRMYINVQVPKGIKKVRWYSDAEYHKMYPNVTVENDIMNFDARHAFGFGPEGFITIYKGHNLEDWADDRRSNLRYNLTFGYYTPGHLELPELTGDIVPVRLAWKQVAAEGNKMKPHEEVQKLVASILGNNSNSQYQGQIDTWIQVKVQVEEKKTKDSRFGDKHTYTLKDDNGNLYIWETGAKDYEIGTQIMLKMKVKEHKEVNGEQTTVVWYCKEL